LTTDARNTRAVVWRLVRPDYGSARIESANFNNIIPAEYRADLVVLLVNGKPVFAIVVEVQLGVDTDKLFSWPAYVVGLHARLQPRPSASSATRTASCYMVT
jgi:hypothetical protein